MSKELTKKAVELLLKGATLVSDPCPYCKGVRIMKDGNALCVNCGKGLIENSESKSLSIVPKEQSLTMDNLDKKLNDLTEELRNEKDYEKQQQILKSISEIITIREKLRKI